jgi:hypothetical protein
MYSEKPGQISRFVNQNLTGKPQNMKQQWRYPSAQGTVKLNNISITNITKAVNTQICIIIAPRTCSL